MSYISSEELLNSLHNCSAVIRAREVIAKVSDTLGFSHDFFTKSAYVLGGCLTRELEDRLAGVGIRSSLGGDIDISLSDPEELQGLILGLLLASSSDTLAEAKVYGVPGDYYVRVTSSDNGSPLVFKYDIATNKAELLHSNNGRSLLILTDSKNGSSRDVQVVLEKISSVDEAVDMIDFGVCKVGVTLSEYPRVVTSSKSINPVSELISQITDRRLEYDTTSRDPVNSLTRLFRYVTPERGYHVSGLTLAKVLKRVSEVDPFYAELGEYVRVDSTGATRDEDNPDSSGY